MQAFATWTALVETTFVLPPRAPGADYRVRIFTPQREIAFAGHPSVGSAHVVLELGLHGHDRPLLLQDCDAGVLPLRVSGSGAMREIAVRSPKARIVQQSVHAPAELASILDGLSLGKLGCALLEGGRRWWLAELQHEAAVRSWSPPHAAIAALARAHDCLGLCVFARAHDAADDYQLVVRAFPAGVGIVEDPASGAANGLIGAWLAQADPTGPWRAGYSVSQGREMGKDARLRVQIDDDGSIWVGGRSFTVIRGALDWPWPDASGS
jgi:PhzF family phenazine biosynthesis protein